MTPRDPGTPEVAGLAPELKGAKKGQGQAPVLSASERFTAYEVEAFEVPAAVRRAGGSPRCAACGACTTAPRRSTATPPIEVPWARRRRPSAATTPASARAACPPTGSRPRRGRRSATATVVTLDGTPEPVTVTVTGPGEGASAASHLQLRTTPHAEATVVIEQRGSGTLADNLEVVLADGSRLTLFVTEEWADDAVHVGAHHFALGRDATLRTTTIALGGDLVRVSPTVNYRAPGGDAELTALGFADARSAPGAAAARRPRRAALPLAA